MTVAGRPDVLRAFDRMDLRPCDRWAHDVPALRAAITAQINHFPAFALPDHESPSVVCGFVHAFGCVTAWMLASCGFERQAHRVLPMQRVLCKTMYAALDAQRMDIEVVKGLRPAERWAEALGFEFEGVRRGAGLGGADLSVYVWPFNEREKHVGIS